MIAMPSRQWFVSNTKHGSAREGRVVSNASERACRALADESACVFCDANPIMARFAQQLDCGFDARVSGVAAVSRVEPLFMMRQRD